MFEAAAMMAIEGAIMFSWLRRRQEAQTGTAEGAYIRDHGAGAYGEARERDVILTDVIESDHANFASNSSTGRRASCGSCTPTCETLSAQIELVRDVDWPPHAVTIRVLDVTGVRVHLAIEGEAEAA